MGSGSTKHESTVADKVDKSHKISDCKSNLVRFFRFKNIIWFCFDRWRYDCYSEVLTYLIKRIEKRYDKSV